jgi:hypothetical protein
MPTTSPWQYARDFTQGQQRQTEQGQNLINQLMMQQIAGQQAQQAAVAEQQAKLPQHILSNLGQLSGTMGNVGAEGLLRGALGQEQPIADPGLLQQLQGQTVAAGGAGIFKDQASGVGSLAQAGFAPGDLNALFGMDIVPHTRPGDIHYPSEGREAREPQGSFEFSVDGGRAKIPVPVEELRAAHAQRMGRVTGGSASDLDGSGEPLIQGGRAVEPRGGPAAKVATFERQLESKGYRRETPLTTNEAGGLSAMYINERENKRVRVHYDAEGNVAK